MGTIKKTDMLALLAELRKIDSFYLPVVKKEYPDGAIGHIKEFLTLCMGLGDYGVKAIVPLYLVIDDWEKWDLSFGDIYPVGIFIDQKIFEEKIVSENYLFRKTGQRSITNTIIKYLNKRTIGSERKTLRLCIDDCNDYKATPESENKKYVVCKIGKEKARLIKEAVNVRDIKGLRDFNVIDFSVSIKKGYADHPHWKILSNNDEQISSIVNNVKLISEKNKDYGGVAVPVINHTPFLDENHDILYFISNTVRDNSFSEADCPGKSIGGLFLLIDKRKIPIVYEEDKNLISFIDLWERLTEKLAVRIIHHYDYERQQNIATRASILDIINRNMSHHISSHVSNRATLDKVLERIDKNYGNLSNAKIYHTILDLLNRFNQYRDERGEYLTYITNFSSPSSAYFFQDVIRPFVENTLLMDNIAANENINYEKDNNGNLINNKLKLKVKLNNSGTLTEFCAYYLNTDKKKLYCSESLPYLRCKNDKLEYPYERIEFSNELNDIEVSLPGTLGKHALYSILENFIRNSAKHGGDVKIN